MGPGGAARPVLPTAVPCKLRAHLVCGPDARAQRKWRPLGVSRPQPCANCTMDDERAYPGDPMNRQRVRSLNGTKMRNRTDSLHER